jgi:hypothetical protein
MDTVTAGSAVSTVWGPDWAWSLPLIAITVVIHASGLQLIGAQVNRLRHSHLVRQQFSLVGVTATFITCLHAFEAVIWAAAYRLLGALPSFHEAILYSLSAMTSYGHTKIALAIKWELMGALESLNGWIVFGLSTAFLFSMLQRVWERESR